MAHRIFEMTGEPAPHQASRSSAKTTPQNWPAEKTALAATQQSPEGNCCFGVPSLPGKE